MPTIYIIYSKTIDSFYVGSCKDLNLRLQEHRQHLYKVAFTKRADDWEVFWFYNVDEVYLARKIELHIKSMKSRKYYHDIKQFPEIIQKLLVRYGTGSCR